MSSAPVTQEVFRKSSALMGLGYNTVYLRIYRIADRSFLFPQIQWNVEANIRCCFVTYSFHSSRIRNFHPHRLLPLWEVLPTNIKETNGLLNFWVPHTRVTVLTQYECSAVGLMRHYNYIRNSIVAVDGLVSIWHKGTCKHSWWRTSVCTYREFFVFM